MKYPKRLWLLLALVSCGYVAEAYKILVVFPTPGPSHAILGDGVVRNLAAAGHEITFITTMPKKTHPSNVRQIDVSSNFNLLIDKIINIEALLNKKVSVDINSMMDVVVNFQNETYQNPNVQALLEDTSQHFDLVIAEWMFCELYAGFSAIYNTPHIWMSTVEPHWMVTRLIDGHLNPAYSADIFSSSSPPFTFVERVQQLFMQIAGLTIRYLFTSAREAEVYNNLSKYMTMRGHRIPTYDEVKFNASLMLGNSHVSLGMPVTLPQNYKEVGGYHIDPKLAPLPADLQQLLDSAEHGVIYFSMGSNLKSKDLPIELKNDLLKMFGTLKQTVLWKFEETLPNLPSNVKIIQWAPQPSILAHPNCILFITHGGLLSTTESVHYGMPIIGVPVFADQFINVDRAVQKGFAKRVDLSYTMADELKEAIVEMVENPAYRNKVKELSFIYHNRPVTPGAELVHWVEHVIKTRGAPHLRSPALQVPFYQKMYLDLFALILAVLWILKTAIRRIFKRSPKKLKIN